MGQAVVGDGRVTEVERIQGGQSLEMRQAGAGDLRMIEDQDL